MVRNYHRKTSRGADGSSYSREDLENAVDDVRNGNQTVRRAALQYNIPRSTLRHYLDGSRGNIGSVAKGGTGGGGKTSLSKRDEESLSQALRIMEKWGFGLSREELFDLVQMYVKENNLKTKFKDGRPSWDWFNKFRDRNNLSIKKPQGVEYVRVNQTNPFAVYGFFDILLKTIKELGLEGKPHLIFNCDETSFSNDPSKTKVVGAKGARSMRMISSSGRDNTTVLACVSAVGEKLPLLCIFKGKNIMESWISTAQTDRTAYAASGRGWMDGIIFCRWFEKCFLQFIPAERPALLVYDGHASHVSVNLIKLARENNVTILKLPPHTTHILQPLDVSVFKSLKVRWDKAICKWQRANPRRRLPKVEFVNLLNQIYDEAPNEIIINGFKSTGIYDEHHNGPNPNAISPDIFKPEELKKYRLYKRDRKYLEVSSNNIDQPNSSAGTSQTGACLPDTEVCKDSEMDSRIEESLEPNSLIESQNDLDTSIQADKNKKTTANPLSELMQASHIEIVVEEPDTSGHLNPREISSTLQTKKYNQRMALLAETSDCSSRPSSTASFEDIILTYINKDRSAEKTDTKTRKRVCTGAEIITSKEYLEKKLQEKSLAVKKPKVVKEKPNPPKKSQQKRKIQIKQVEVSSSSSENDSFVSDDDAEEEELNDVVSVIPGDFVKVMYNNQYYPGKVLEISVDQVKVSHMEASGMKGWRWPKKEDELWYSDKDIVKIIKPPKLLNNRGIYSVPEVEGTFI